MEAAVLSIDASGLVRILGRGDRCERWLAGIREGAQLETALHGIDQALASGLAAAVRERLACSGCRVVRPSWGLHLLSYSVRWPSVEEAPEIVLATLSSTPSDILAQLDREQERRSASMEALGMLDPRAGRDGGVSAALPSMIRATGMQTGAVFAGEDRDVAHLVAAYGPTRKRGYPYPDLRLDWPPLEPLLRGARRLVPSTTAPLTRTPTRTGATRTH